MSVLSERINKILNKKGLSIYKLSKIIDYPDSPLGRIIKGKIQFSENVIEKLLPILEVSKEEFTGWIIADKYSKESIQVAISELKNKSDDMLVLTKNIDKILSEKGLSRTALSKLVNYSQSGLNRMIIGQISMSKTIVSRLAPILDISEDIIYGWSLADKYSLEVLRCSVF